MYLEDDPWESTAAALVVWYLLNVVEWPRSAVDDGRSVGPWYHVVICQIVVIMPVPCSNQEACGDRRSCICRRTSAPVPEPWLRVFPEGDMVEEWQDGFCLVNLSSCNQGGCEE